MHNMQTMANININRVTQIKSIYLGIIHKQKHDNIRKYKDFLS